MRWVCLVWLVGYTSVACVGCIGSARGALGMLLYFANLTMCFVFCCLVEDSERNDGSAEKPYYMSENLRDILGK